MAQTTHSQDRLRSVLVLAATACTIVFNALAAAGYVNGVSPEVISNKYLTVITPAYDEFTVESSPYREAGEDESSMCTYQDLLVDDEINPNPVRPCFGTWGFPRLPIDMWVTVELTAPEGYTLTSDSTQVILTGTDTGWIDFGIAPLTAAE